MKMLFLDVETTGLDPRQHTIHQLSGQVFIDGEFKEEFDFDIQPHERGRIDSAALRVSGLSVAEIMLYPSRQMQSQKFFEILRKYVDRYDKYDKFFFVAYNAHFDNGFLRKFMEQNGDKYFGSYFWSNNIDVMVLAAEHLKEVRHKMVNFKQVTVAKELGIEVDESQLHNSLYDIKIMRQIYEAVTKKEVV